jgi:hypothetical protein
VGYLRFDWPDQGLTCEIAGKSNCRDLRRWEVDQVGPVLEPAIHRASRTADINAVQERLTLPRLH